MNTCHMPHAHTITHTQSENGNHRGWNELATHFFLFFFAASSEVGGPSIPRDPTPLSEKLRGASKGRKIRALEHT